MVYKWIIREIIDYVDEDARRHQVDTEYSVNLPETITPLDVYRMVRSEKIEVNEYTTYGLEFFSFVEKQEYGNDEVQHRVYVHSRTYTYDKIDLTRKIISVAQNDDPSILTIPKE